VRSDDLTPIGIFSILGYPMIDSFVSLQKTLHFVVLKLYHKLGLSSVFFF